MESPDLTLPSVLTLKRAAQELSVSRTTLYRMMRACELATVRIHGREMVPASEIRRLATPGVKTPRAAASPRRTHGGRPPKALAEREKFLAAMKRR